MVLRHARSPVLPSADVFPGGTVRADDLHLEIELEEAQRLARALAERSDSPVPAEQATAYYVSALRELFEEAGGCCSSATRMANSGQTPSPIYLADS